MPAAGDACPARAARTAALQRFLREDENPWGARFKHWEALCRGEVLDASGKEPAMGRYGDAGQARTQFDRLFRQDLDQLEAAFREWLAKL